MSNEQKNYDSSLGFKATNSSCRAHIYRTIKQNYVIFLLSKTITDSSLGFNGTKKLQIHLPTYLKLFDPDLFLAVNDRYKLDSTPETVIIIF
jgi:hypothetical protein